MVVTLVAGQGFALAPMIDEQLPDVQLIVTPTGTPAEDDWELDLESFDLDDFIMDADTAPGDISWSRGFDTGHQFYSASGPLTPSAPLSYILPRINTDNTVDIWGFQYTGTLKLKYTASDGVNTDGEAGQTVHFASFRVRSPQVGLDNRVGTVVSTPFTWVIGGEAITSGASLTDTSNLDLLTSGAWVETGGPTPVYDWMAFDLQGNDITSSVGSSLSIDIDAAGQFSVIPVMGGSLGNMPVLDEPVIVSFVALHPDGISDWNGASVLMTPGLTPNVEPKPSVQAFSQFEAFSNGDTIPDVASGYASGWALVLGKTTASHQIISSGYPTASWPGAASGNVLQLTVSSDNRQVRIISGDISPIEPGATYGLSMNVATDSTDSSQTPRVFLRAVGQPAGDNTTGMKVGKTAVPVAADGWKQLFTTYTEPIAASTVPGADGTGSYNFHYSGVRLFLQFAAFPVTPETNIYCDNVYFYKLSDGGPAVMDDEGISYADLDVGAVARSMGFKTSGTAVPDPILGDLEASSLALAGWEYTLVGDTDSGTSVQLQPKFGSQNVNDGDSIELGTAALDTSGTRNYTPMLGAANSFMLKLDGARGREATDTHYGIRYALRGVYLDGTARPGVYTLDCYVQTDASSFADCPIATVGMMNVGATQFDALATTVLQGPTLPFGARNVDGSANWRHLSLTGTFMNVSEVPLAPLGFYFQAVATVNSSVDPTVPRVPAGVYSADPIMGTAAGYDTAEEIGPYYGDAALYFDEVSIKAVNINNSHYDADLLFDPRY